ncbi:MAG: response regulator [Bacteroidales bacterium]|nr:response regulator [Bacteroidales bacterium]
MKFSELRLRNKSYRILIVDDEIACLELFVKAFEEHHPEYIIFQALDPQKALKIAKEELPDVIISDWVLSDMSGIDLIKLLKEEPLTMDIPVIISSGAKISSDDLEEALKAGAFDYLKKPIDPIELMARTNSALQITKRFINILENKNIELVQKDLFSVKNTEFYDDLKKRISQIGELCNLSNPKLKLLFDELNFRIQNKISEDSWQKFNISFSATHPLFIKRLTSEYPNLTPGEIKLCTLIKLGVKTKEIASILYQTQGSVKVSRSRLRAKLNLELTQNLESFLEKFS